MTAVRSDAFVFFGATGDLAYRKIFPALQALARSGNLDLPVIGMAREGWSLEQLRERAHDSLEKHGGVDPVAFDRLSKQLRYVGGDYTNPATYQRLKHALGDASRPLHYLAVPPSMFGRVVQGLADAGCADGARIVVEKPFGRDLASARELNRTVHEVFAEPAIFRIDHYLGKEAVQNLQYFRFANTFLDPVWNHHYVERVQITMAEESGVEGRGSFYEEVGALRDVVQNHLLQVTALLAMDAPAGRHPDAVRAEKLRLFRAMRPLDADHVVRGQFRGYRQEPGVAPDSNVETFVALCLHIDTWRWAGVPFHIRTGKRLAATTTEVLVDLKCPALAVFDRFSPAESDYFRFRLSPEVVIAIGARVKQHGDEMRGERVELVARHEPSSPMLEYERLLGDALEGDPGLFTRDDSVEAAWQVIEPVLDHATALHDYEPGTWGPSAAATILTGAAAWHDPEPERSPPC